MIRNRSARVVAIVALIAVLWARSVEAAPPSMYTIDMASRVPSVPQRLVDIYVPGSASNRPRPLVVFVHGFGRGREHNSDHGWLLSSLGMVVAMPDDLRGPAIVDVVRLLVQGGACDAAPSGSGPCNGGQPFRIDPNRIALVGQSAAGGTVIEAAEALQDYGLHARAIVLLDPVPLSNRFEDAVSRLAATRVLALRACPQLCNLYQYRSDVVESLGDRLGVVPECSAARCGFSNVLLLNAKHGDPESPGDNMILPICGPLTEEGKAEFRQHMLRFLLTNLFSGRQR